jgi:hypothetical protein
LGLALEAWLKKLRICRYNIETLRVIRCASFSLFDLPAAFDAPRFSLFGLSAATADGHAAYQTTQK